MPAVVIPIDARAGAPTGGKKERACWSLLELARPGRQLVPLGILLADDETDVLTIRLLDADCFDDLEEDEADFLAALPGDLLRKSREAGAAHLLDGLEDSLSHFLRIGDRTAIAYAGDAQAAADRLFDEHVDGAIRPFVTHLPLYGLRAAATKFGEGMESEHEGWLRAPEKLRLKEGMFVAQVVGRSMEPLIPDGSLCVFRAPVTGSRQGRVVLIENFGENDFAARYTVKRYARHAGRDESAEREAPIRLEPLNREFEAFELEGDRFRVIAEFVQVLPS
jgi:SOS-response transcriptional repressor LexA